MDILIILVVFAITVLPLFTWITSEAETEETKVANAKRRFEKRMKKEAKKALKRGF